MIKTKKEAHTIELYDSIEDMPHARYMKFNKEMMRAAEVGHAPEDVLTRIDKTFAYLKAGYTDKAAKELSNARLTFVYAANEIDPAGLALAALVKTIDGVECLDVSSEGLKNTLQKLQDIGYTKGDVNGTTQQVKKKWRVSSGFSLLKRLALAMYHTIKPSLKS